MTESEAIEELKYDCNELGKAIPCDTSWGCSFENAYEMAIQAFEKLEDYKNLEEQGRLVKLPCKAVYFIVDINNPKYAAVMKRPIRELAIYEIEGIDKSGCKYFSTKEKAEAKLKELRCNNE
nr:MAG TPA: hypothetical protein [Caudoviricetes sp.]